jgi:hypothetical protein
LPPDTISDRIVTLVRPELTGVQLVPLLVERKTPALLVPAKTLLPLTAKELTEKNAFETGSPVSATVQLLPSLVERKTPNKFAVKTLLPLITRAWGPKFL